MSGFLSRLAARTGGAPVGITPRVPSLFGHTEALSGETPFALETTLTVPDRHTDSSVVRGVSPEPPTPSMPVRTTRLPQTVVDSVPRDPMSPRPESHHKPVQARAVGTTPVPSVSPPPLADTDHAQLPLRPRPILPQVPAAPAFPASAPPRPDLTAGEPTRETGRGPDVVHISIGRVEVRAAAPAPVAVAPAPTRPDASAPTLSLADYLRGGRVQR
ncbi:hypothetical protein [Mycolicibacterium psychrotolerans]|uniref:Uncharacterized protein n=1 Tax=Mycolicibacterium psychrotolerans TaxID=216929 RepID=A0A7I7MF07_9MYCO|nr:hypothetical protein [Mycolicibacterium psychrotolerans]BBX69949.1 hypothetical protein MPSYJ_34100 [Mycolicibacterium psychrotolerans]